MPKVERVEPGRASDDAFVAELVDVVNSAYFAAEATLWTIEVPRTNDDELRGWIKNGELVVAVDDQSGRAVGSVYTRAIDAQTVGFGALSVHPDFGRRGIGGQLLDYIENEAAFQGAQEMQLEVLTTTAAIDRLHRLYARYEHRGYREVGRVDAAVMMDEWMPYATVPLEIIVMRKRLF